MRRKIIQALIEAIRDIWLLNTENYNLIGKNPIPSIPVAMVLLDKKKI
jgi:hypothetical protein